MEHEITALDLHYLLRELAELKGARVDKIFQQQENKRDFLFVFHKPEKGKLMLRISLPGLVYFTDKKAVFPQQPPGYCMFLRKYLSGTRVVGVKQHDFERIIEFTFRFKENSFILIVEMFSKGNMILCEDDYKIKSPLENQNWKDRTIRGGIKYSYPPKQIDTKGLSKENFLDEMDIAKNEELKNQAEEILQTL